MDSLFEVFGFNTLFLLPHFWNITDFPGFSSGKGINDWQHLSQFIKRHELSKSHFNNYSKWKIATNMLSSERTVDFQLINQFQQEKNRLKLMFQRIIPLIICFAKQNIAFTGISSNLYDPSGKNGNFQQIIHAIAKFDNVLKEHIENHKYDHYLSPKI